MVKVTFSNHQVFIPFSGKKEFYSNIALRKESIKKCVEFAMHMTQGKGHHLDIDFGNRQYPRQTLQIFRDTVQGKVAEIGLYNYFVSQGIPVDAMPQFEVWGQGKWEDCDFTLCKERYKIAVKSTKHIGNLLLLEKHRYNANGAFVETTKGSGSLLYDFIFLVRIAGCEDLSLGKVSDAVIANIKCEITGFISHQFFLEVIKQQQVIPAGTRLGQTMKVDNYYVCTSDLMHPSTLKNLILKNP